MAIASIPARYRYISTLGSGGMATVVLAEDTLLGREVALKRLTGAGDPRGLSRLRREALVGASVSHPNLVSIFDVVADADGDVIIVMEYVRGETLREALSDQRKLAISEALRVLGSGSRPRHHPRSGHRAPRRQAGEHPARHGRFHQGR